MDFYSTAPPDWQEILEAAEAPLVLGGRTVQAAFTTGQPRADLAGLVVRGGNSDQCRTNVSRPSILELPCDHFKFLHAQDLHMLLGAGPRADSIGRLLAAGEGAFAGASQ
jgi:hypothetical protein